MNRRSDAKGFAHRNRTRIVCDFDPDAFEEVRTRAEREGTSIAEQVRLLVEWGLMADEDDVDA